ncbi:predicted protein [Plenodomus lingam JN3]|uniref:Predicted protein n=1 Tax=Leptosphaeria maculans (strain JN3 / isolate v23.1.3 / race Av1-4-5-6-7-8) TaxID=985895 RepID=E5A538_LEPMJ|nr:predicted protein [Plenodomus lingam JN3]CBX98736.1 predicted protein [Plenodomus lingam JN3]
MPAAVKPNISDRSGHLIQREDEDITTSDFASDLEDSRSPRLRWNGVEWNGVEWLASSRRRDHSIISRQKDQVGTILMSANATSMHCTIRNNASPSHMTNDCSVKDSCR